MPDSNPVAEAPASAPATPVTEAQAPEQSAAAPAPAASPAPDDSAHWSWLEQQSPDTLFARSPRVRRYADSKAGEIVSKQKDAWLQAERPRIVQEADLERLESQRRQAVAQDDGIEAIRLEREIDTRRRALQEPQQVQQQATAAVYSGLQARINALAADEPKEVVEAAAQAFKPDPTASFEDNFAGWWRGFTKAREEHAVSQAIKDQLPALVQAEVKKHLGATVGREPAPDLGAGQAPAGKRTYTRAEIDRMSLAEFRSLEKDIDLAVKEGRIR